MVPTARITQIAMNASVYRDTLVILVKKVCIQLAQIISLQWLILKDLRGVFIIRIFISINFHLWGNLIDKCPRLVNINFNIFLLPEVIWSETFLLHNFFIFVSVIPCGDLAAVDNAKFTITGYMPNDTITYTCLEGYEHSEGMMTRECNLGGNWNGSPPTCTGIPILSVFTTNFDRGRF